jgi:hypothetical protein
LPVLVKHVLVISVGRRRGAVVNMQLDGFARFASELRRELGVRFDTVEVPTLEFVAHAVTLYRTDVVVLVPNWSEPAESVMETIRSLRSQPVQPRIVYLDTFDPTSSPHFGVLPLVDRYLKTKALRDSSNYCAPWQGGHVLSDHAARVLKCDLEGWYFGSAVDPAHVNKIVPCWNFGIAHHFERLLRPAELLGREWASRSIDVNRRISLPHGDDPSDTWYGTYRRASQEALDPLASRVRCTQTDRVHRRKYLWEMVRSKIVFSPFGWGEVCFRDYEAVACGCLLVKPSMEHVATSPDIFVPGETYVPVKWDFSDLVPVIEECLANPARSARIAANARRVLTDYYTRGGFVADVRRSLEGLVEMSPGPSNVPALVKA